MTDNKEKRVSRVREMKNDLILDGALKVFAEKGFHDTRLEDIAQEVGFSKASLYNYYKDKEEIFLSLATREYMVIHERLQTDPLLKLDHSLSLRENIRRILSLVFTTFGNHFAFVLTLNSFQFLSIFHESKFHHCSDSENDFMEARCCVDDSFVALVKAAQAKGEISSKQSPEQLHDYFDALIFATIRRWHQSGQMENIDETISGIVDFIAQGFGIQS